MPLVPPDQRGDLTHVCGSAQSRSNQASILRRMSVERCPVVILCGGKGTRLREETEYKPKPMVEIGGRPILWHVMRNFAIHGFHEFVICLGYRGELIREYFLHYGA